MKLDFEINGFRDALNLPDDHTLTDVEIEAMKQARYDKWYAIITAIPDEPMVIAPSDEV